MRGLRLAVFVVLVGGLAEMSILACHSNSASDDNEDAGDAGDDGDAFGGFDVGGGVVGEDANDFPETYSFSNDGGPCALANGVYTVTATPTDDGGANCPAWTSTITFAADQADAPGACIGGPGTGEWSSDGELPACTVNFSCSSDNGVNSTQTTGQIVVLEGSYAGTVTSQVYSDADASSSLYTCVYHLDYTQQP